MNSQGNSWEQSQQAIDVEIKSLEESIRALKHRRNALSPVSSLPPELFAAIFSFLCLPGTSSLDASGKPEHHLARLCVSHVCHQWRKIALNQPLLWSHVDFNALSLAGAVETLVRAKSAPLYLEASVSGHYWDDVRSSTFRKELQACVPHIRHLRTSAKPVHLHRTLKGLVSPAPTLEYLSLSSRGGYRNRRIRKRLFIPDALFDGSTPRLSCLELSNWNISWKSPLLKRLKYLEILTPSANARPKLAVWLDALDEMPQLMTLTLHSASPIAPPFPFDVERTVTLPSLTRLDILASPGDCALALAHLDLPALTWLCITAISPRLPNSGYVQELLPYVARHAHGPQDTQPLQSVLICSEHSHAGILAWTVPDIHVEVHNPPTLLAAMLPTRMALSFMSGDWHSFEERLEVLDTALAGLPLDGLVTLVAHNLSEDRSEDDLPTQHFWLHLSPKWPLLRRVQLGPPAARGFIVMLLADNRGCERPLLPSLTELVVVDVPTLSSLPLCDALMKRTEQGVPVEMLDLRMCDPHYLTENWLQSLSEVVSDVLGPDETWLETTFMWLSVGGAFVDNERSREDNHSHAGSDDEDERGEE